MQVLLLNYPNTSLASSAYLHFPIFTSFMVCCYHTDCSTAIISLLSCELKWKTIMSLKFLLTFVLSIIGWWNYCTSRCMFCIYTLWLSLVQYLRMILYVFDINHHANPSQCSQTCEISQRGIKMSGVFVTCIQLNCSVWYCSNLLIALWMHGVISGNICISCQNLDFWFFISEICIVYSRVGCYLFIQYSSFRLSFHQLTWPLIGAVVITITLAIFNYIN